MSSDLLIGLLVGVPSFILLFLIILIVAYRIEVYRSNAIMDIYNKRIHNSGSISPVAVVVDVEGGDNSEDGDDEERRLGSREDQVDRRRANWDQPPPDYFTTIGETTGHQGGNSNNNNNHNNNNNNNTLTNQLPSFNDIFANGHEQFSSFPTATTATTNCENNWL